MKVPELTYVEFGGDPESPLLVLGPSLGTSAETLWSACADGLVDRFRVVGYDLPGHGTNAGVAEPFGVAELARGVLGLVDELVGGDQVFSYAGDSVGGAVGLQLLLDAPERIEAAVVLCTGAVIGTADGWQQRAALVRTEGTVAVVDSSRQRWFGPGFVDRQPLVAEALLGALRATDAEGYARVCEALAGFDVLNRLAEITVPVLGVGGSDGLPTPAAGVARIAAEVRLGSYVELDGVGHLAPAERPARVASLIMSHLDRHRRSPTLQQIHDDGMAVRRQVLGDAHVDRAAAATTDLTADFQQLITQYAWGSIWTRPGLDRRSRSMITLTALIARGHHEELAMHLRAARTNGLSRAEITEVILQSAVYCGVPDANTAFRIAQQVLAELDGPLPS